MKWCVASAASLGVEAASWRAHRTTLHSRAAPDVRRLNLMNFLKGKAISERVWLTLIFQGAWTLRFLLYDMHYHSFRTCICNTENLLRVGGDHWWCILCGRGIAQRKRHPCRSDSADGPEDDGALWRSDVSPRRTHQGKADPILPSNVMESTCLLISYPKKSASAGVWWQRAKPLQLLKLEDIYDRVSSGLQNHPED